MGATQPKTDSSHQIPTQGCKIIQVLNPQLEQKIQPFTDYIISPTLQNMKVAKEDVEVTIFSILDYSIRKKTLPITDNHIGVKIKHCKVRDCILRITKIFSNSPCQKLGITFDEYIVGLVEAEYQNLQGFAEAMKRLMTTKHEVITMAICNQSGQTRLVIIPFILLDQWKTHNKGILGCQLAEGWMNRFKVKLKTKQNTQIGTSSIQSSNIPQPENEKSIKENTKELMIQTMNELKKEEKEDSEGSEQIERRCDELMGVDNNIIEVNFKGLLKNEYLDDASTICKCKIYDKNCEKCFVEKENNYYFFNKKTNRIINIPYKLLFKVQG